MASVAQLVGFLVVWHVVLKLTQLVSILLQPSQGPHTIGPERLSSQYPGARSAPLLSEGRNTKCC